MKRGEIWTASGGPDYGTKPRPVVVLQDDRFDSTHSVTVCLLTTTLTEMPLFRPGVRPSTGNGLKAPCHLMADKITTFPRTKLRSRIGWLDDADIMRLNRAVLTFLGLAG